MRKLIQEIPKGRCPTVKFSQQVDFVLTISAEWYYFTQDHNHYIRSAEAAAFHCLSIMGNKTYKHMFLAAVPALSMAAIVRGAITYGFNIVIVHDRMLKWSHGIEVCCS
ncbi:hypothetical protein C1646_739102 [Rhizophagus diaphanus]|nr:hypothetical protein C1646_739102 [Rhizophagus diaphanus] [Rhizophagus sp. MUCL 43196]